MTEWTPAAAAQLSIMFLQHCGVSVEMAPDGDGYVAHGIPGHPNVRAETEGRAWHKAHCLSSDPPLPIDLPEMWDKPWVTEPTFSSHTQGQETILAHCVLGQGYKGVCCDCHRDIVWTADDLLERFAGALGATMRDVASRLKCAGCGSRRLYLWPFQSVPIDTGHRSVASRAERELVIVARADEIVARRRSELETPEGSHPA